MKSLVGPITGLICSLFIVAPLSMTSAFAAEVTEAKAKSFNKLKCESYDKRTTISASLDGLFASTNIDGKLAIYESTYNWFHSQLNLDLDSLDVKPLLVYSVENIRTFTVPLTLVSKGSAIRYKPGVYGKVEYQFLADIGVLVTNTNQNTQDPIEVVCHLYK